MKLSLSQLRKLIEEESLRGVPEFMYRELTSKLINDLKQQIKRHILMTKGSSESEREAFQEMEDVLHDLENEVVELIEQKLWRFTQRT